MTSDNAEYCRSIEAYLCQKNDGHLIRLVGPSFERVLGWAAQGIPFKIVCEGIDRCFVRYYAKGPKRRPVQIEFCEADVLEAFEEWRRAVGFHAAERKMPQQSLPKHLVRVLERLTTRLSAVGTASDSLHSVLSAIANDVSSLSEQQGSVRGAARLEVLAKLDALDRAMIEGARELADPAVLTALRKEAADSLRAFRDRMPADAYQQAVAAATDRLLRQREQLPIISFDAGL